MQKEWRNLIKPKSVEIDTRVTTNSYGRFIVEPFERGFGTTIGNALRRILLSSLPGFAITAVKINGVLHEFSTLPGVKEDVSDIILNLKEVRLKLHETDQLTATLKKKGEGIVVAGDITGGPNLEILTPEQHIATLDRDANFDLELEIRKGRGYVPAEQREQETTIGTISLDAVFSPIRKVNFTVTNTRVGQRTDYDRLVMEIWTDGSVSAHDALIYAAQILRDHTAIFVGAEEEAEISLAREEAEGEAPQELNESLFRPVESLPISVRAFNGLQNADIKYVCELVQRTEQEMLKIKNFGRKSLSEIKEILAEMGLSLGMKLENLPSRAQLDKMREEQEARESA